MPGAGGVSRRSASVRSSNWAILRCWVIGCTSNLFTEACPSCRSGLVPFPKRRLVCSRYSWRCWRSHCCAHAIRREESRLRGLRWWSRLLRRQLDDFLVAARQAVLFARDLADRFRVTLQVLYVLLQLTVFLVELFQVLAHLPNLLLLLLHGQVAMGAENIVHQQQRDEDAHQMRRIMEQLIREFFLLDHQAFRIQPEASFTSFFVAASLSASA